MNGRSRGSLDPNGRVCQKRLEPARGKRQRLTIHTSDCKERSEAATILYIGSEVRNGDGNTVVTAAAGNWPFQEWKMDSIPGKAPR
jgi:hypothetical protein